MTLADRFASAQGNHLEVDGCTLYWTFYIPVSTGDSFEFRFRDFARSPVQGLAIDCDLCQGEIAGQKARSFQLWTDTAPERVSLRIHRAKSGARLSIFNVWGDESHSPMLYRLNDAAIYVDGAFPGPVVLRCSDGYGNLDLSDLVVEIVKG
jgi:hypothetical protein